MARQKAFDRVGACSLLAPTGPGRPWRLTYYLDGEPKGARAVDEASIRRKAEAINAQLAAATGDMEQTPWAVAVADYLSTPEGRFDGNRRRAWKTTTYNQRRQRFAQMARGDVPGLQCSDIDRAMLDKMRRRAGTPRMVVQNTGALRSFLRWGEGSYFAADASAMLPRRCTYPQPQFEGDPGRQRTGSTRQVGDDISFVTDEDAPSLGAVWKMGLGLAEVEPRWGMLAAQCAAWLGLRWGEQFCLTADDVELFTADNGVPMVAVKVVKQVDSQARVKDGGDRLTSPKGGKFRRTIAPAVVCDRDGTFGYRLGRELMARAEKARAEQADGTNSGALLFPTKSGKLLHHTSFKRSYFNPAATSANWDRKRWVAHPLRWNAATKRYEEQRLKRVQWTNVWHSMRHRFARTCVDIYRMDAAHLTMVGGWEDPDVVFKRYYKPGAEHAAQAVTLTAAAGAMFKPQFLDDDDDAAAA